MLASEKAEDNCVSAFWSSWLVKSPLPKRCAVASNSSCQATWRESPRWRPSAPRRSAPRRVTRGARHGLDGCA